MKNPEIKIGKFKIRNYSDTTILLSIEDGDGVELKKSILEKQLNVIYFKHF